KLQAHRETRELPVFVLSVAKGGIKLRPSSSNCILFNRNEPARSLDPAEPRLPLCSNIVSGNGVNMQWNAQNIDMSGLVSTVANATDRSVIDKTGFTGRFDVNVQFTLNPAPGDLIADSLVSVLENQFGLKLESGRGPVEVFVIDHIERPSEN